MTRASWGSGRLRVAVAGLVVGGTVVWAGVAGAAQEAAPAAVDVVDTAYSPASVSIQTGESVTWTVNSVQVHNVEGQTGPDPAWANGAYSTPLERSGTRQFTFNQPGTYTYLCIAHPEQMKGTVTVTGSPVTPTPTPSSTATPSPTASTTATPSATAAPSPTAGASGSGGTGGDARTTPAPGAIAADTKAPVISGVRARGIRRGARVTLTLDETSTVAVKVKRRKARSAVRSARLQVRAGKRTLTVRTRRLKAGPYVVELRASDARGNRSALKQASFRITRARG